MVEPNGVEAEEETASQNTGGFCHVYKSYVSDSSDLEGVIAYCLYKEQKNSFLSDFKKKNNRFPNEQEWSGFFGSVCGKEAIESHKARAKEILNNFVMLTHIEDMDQYVDNFLKDRIENQLENIFEKMNESKKFLGMNGWLGDVLKSTISGMFGVLAIGLLVVGSFALDKWLTSAKNEMYFMSRLREDTVNVTKEADNNSSKPFTTKGDPPAP